MELVQDRIQRRFLVVLNLQILLLENLFQAGILIYSSNKTDIRKHRTIC